MWGDHFYRCVVAVRARPEPQSVLTPTFLGDTARPSTRARSGPPEVYNQ